MLIGMYEGMKYRWLRRKYGLTSLPESFGGFKKTFPRGYYNLDSDIFPYIVSRCLIDEFDSFKRYMIRLEDIMLTKEISTAKNYLEGGEVELK